MFFLSLDPLHIHPTFPPFLLPLSVLPRPLIHSYLIPLASCFSRASRTHKNKHIPSP